MFPRISDLINYLFGTNLSIPVQSYGFMMALAFLLGAIVLYGELKRKEREGRIPAQKKTVIKGAPATVTELSLSVIMGFILGWKFIGIIFHYQDFSTDPQGFILSGQGSFPGGILTGIGILLLTYYQKKKQQSDPPVSEEVTIHPYQLTGNIVLIAAVFGILGAKLFDMFESIDKLVSDPIGTILSFDGMAFYGGLIVAAFAVVYYAHRNKITMANIMDAIAPSLILAYAIGRIGCQLAGDGCWGIVNTSPMPSWLVFLPDWMWSFRYPHNVIDEGMRIQACTGSHCFVLPYPVYPTPLYETLLGLVIFLVLMTIRKHLNVPGHLFCVYLILNGIERFFIEKIRINPVHDIAGLKLTQAEIIAILLIIIGSVGLVYFKKVSDAVTIKEPAHPNQKRNP
ncbi:MAG: prolipoprotein diacylglyceryl transferase family protein [bacterium]